MSGRGVHPHTHTVFCLGSNTVVGGGGVCTRERRNFSFVVIHPACEVGEEEATQGRTSEGQQESNPTRLSAPVTCVFFFVCVCDARDEVGHAHHLQRLHLPRVAGVGRAGRLPQGPMLVHLRGGRDDQPADTSAREKKKRDMPNWEMEGGGRGGGGLEGWQGMCAAGEDKFGGLRRCNRCVFFFFLLLAWFPVFMFCRVQTRISWTFLGTPYFFLFFLKE